MSSEVRRPVGVLRKDKVCGVKLHGRENNLIATPNACSLESTHNVPGNGAFGIPADCTFQPCDPISKTGFDNALQPRVRRRGASRRCILKRVFFASVRFAGCNRWHSTLARVAVLLHRTIGRSWGPSAKFSIEPSHRPFPM